MALVFHRPDDRVTRASLGNLSGVIRTASVNDIPEIHTMVRELAEYERSLKDATATAEEFHTALFGAHPIASALIAEDDTTKETAGFALWFRNFSTWTGVGIRLEDIYVRPWARGNGHGRALLAALAAICAEHGYQRLEWVVLDWNKPSIRFYQSLGAERQDEWQTFRLSGPRLSELALSSSK